MQEIFSKNENLFFKKKWSKTEIFSKMLTPAHDAHQCFKHSFTNNAFFKIINDRKLVSKMFLRLNFFFIMLGWNFFCGFTNRKTVKKWIGYISEKNQKILDSRMFWHWDPGSIKKHKISNKMIENLFSDIVFCTINLMKKFHSNILPTFS
jgi:hypothetical protein